ncbi:hypothetical protein O3M35_002150 [Rhynocoris fuscipes]|uniref:Uncharacterized protein n=1 Tax=Rhynocoris fuscipes TaxID=488301 RepID=A0AAW1CTQ2_9HEMI
MTSLYTYLNLKFLPGSSYVLSYHVIILCRGITPKLMKIPPCCWVSLKSSQRVLFNAIKKKKKKKKSTS